jgi:hypothetical protein
MCTKVFKYNSKGGWGMAPVVKSLLSKHEALSSNTVPPKPNQNKNNPQPRKNQ